MNDFNSNEESAKARYYKSLANTDISVILDKTQEHLILQLDAIRHDSRFSKIGLPTLYSLIALSLLIIFATKSFLQGQILHAQILAVFSILTIAGIIFLRISDNRKTLISLIIFLYATLCLFLFISGGVNGTGPLWFFVFPVTAVFIQSLWKGLVSTILLLLISFFIYYLDVPAFDSYRYSSDFLQRFVAVYLTITAMSFFYVFSRTTTELNIDTISKSYQEMANTDELTKLANRRHMANLLRQEISRANRSKRSFSIIIFDLDYFKKINDEYGHDAGDEILKSTPVILGGILRTQDFCARWGGEEFLVMLPDTLLEGARFVAERLRHAFSKNIVKYDSHDLSVTVSLGVSEYKMEETFESFLKRTDHHLYKAKAAGRNSVIS